MIRLLASPAALLLRLLLVVILVLGLEASNVAADPLDGRDPVDDVFYQFMPISWRDSNNDAQRFGDFGGMTASLDYLQGLGVTAVWMNPIFPSAAYHGYQHGPGDQINSRFGNEADFVAFIAAAHARGIKVFVDFVVYGISQNSVWYQSAYNNPASPYDDWLAFTNAANTTYLGSTYTTWNGASLGFIHWNLNNTNPVGLVTTWAQHWLDPNGDGNPADGLDGYRLDHVWNQYNSGPNGWGYNIDDFWIPWQQALAAVNPDVFIFAEQADWGSTGADLLPAFDAAFTKPFEFAARDALTNGSAGSLYSSMDATLAALPANKLFLGTIGDHDVDRLASAIGADTTPGKAKAAAAVLMTQPFPPIVYYGDELGMRGKKASYGGDANDIPMREPFKWNAVAGPPMSNYWILNNAAYNGRYAKDNDGRSVQEQQGVAGSLLEEYRTLITARKNNIALRRGTYNAVTNSATSVWSFLRHAAGQQTLLVTINLAGATSPTLNLSNLSIPGGATQLVDIFTGTPLATALTTANQAAYPLSLAAYQYRIFSLNGTPTAPPPQEIDGYNIPTDQGPGSLRATQNNATGFGDNQSELDQLFVRVENNKLRVGLTGNLATDGTGMALFFDSVSGGQNTLSTSTFSQPPGGIPQISGMVLDSGFSADYILFINASGGSIYVDLYTLATAGGGSKRYVGNGTVNDHDGFLNGASNPNGMQAALTNNNTAGVTASSAASAGTATSGFELSVPLADIGVASPTGSIRLMAMLLRSDGTVSNQFLPGLGGGYANLGHVPINLNNVAGNQFASIALARAPGDWDGDGDVDLDDYAEFAGCLTGPGPAALGPGCNAFDFDIDNDVDLADYNEFQQARTP